MRAKAVDSVTTLRIGSDRTLIAEVLTISCRVAERIANRCHHRHCIGPYQIPESDTASKQKSKAFSIVTCCVKRFNDIKDKVEKREESSEERTGNYRPNVFDDL